MTWVTLIPIRLDIDRGGGYGQESKLGGEKRKHEAEADEETVVERRKGKTGEESEKQIDEHLAVKPAPNSF